MGFVLAAKLALGAALAATLFASGPEARFPEPELVSVPPGTITFRPAGEYLRAGIPVAPAPAMVRFERRLSIMKFPVSAAEYRVCVDAGACPRAAGTAAAPDHPAVDVSWRDAVAYAKFLSARTGRRYRLPSDAEWAYAAGSRFRDGALADLTETDRAARSIERYEKESLEERAEKATRPIGSFGANERGLVDVAGNVWEWTSTCFRRFTLDAAGAATGAPVENCGVRVLAGRHRAYVADFVRDARSGGCATGIPPANLGFRLVRERG